MANFQELRVRYATYNDSQGNTKGKFKTAGWFHADGEFGPYIDLDLITLAGLVTLQAGKGADRIRCSIVEPRDWAEKTVTKPDAKKSGKTGKKGGKKGGEVVVDPPF